MDEVDDEVDVPPARRNGRWRPASYLGFLLVVVLLVDSIWVGVRLVGLAGAARELDSAASSFRDLRFEEAERSVRDAEEAARGVVGATRHPSFRLATWIPGLDRDAAALRTIAAAAELAASAGREGIGGLRAMGVHEGGVAETIYRDGQVDLEAVEAGSPQLDAAARLLSRAAELLQRAAEPRARIIEGGLARARAEIVPLSRSAERGRAFLGALPSVLGGDRPARYLLLFQAPGEARGTGGVVGLHGVLVAHRGRIRLSRVASVHQGLSEPGPRVQAPQWFEESYGPQASLREWQQVNLSPNFPTVAEVFLEMYERRFGDELEGVLAMDPIAFEGFLRATGPIEVEGEQLSAANAAEFLLEDQYERFDDDVEQETYLAGFVDAFWDRLRLGRLDSRVFGEELGRASRAGHLKVYSRDRGVQAALEVSGVHGWLNDDDDNVQMIFHNNYGINKVDAFLRRRFETKVQVMPNGDAEVVTTVRLRNQAEAGDPSLLLGWGDVNRVGANRMLLNLMVPPGSELGSFSIDGRSRSPAVFEEEGARPVAWDVLEIAPGESKQAVVAYRIPNAVDISEGRGEFYAMTLFPQAAVRPDAYSLTVEAPSGFDISEVEGPDGFSVDRFARAEGELDEKKTFVVQLRPR